MVMTMEMVKERAELFLKYDKRVFIKTIRNDYFFCDILTCGEDFIYVQSFEGKRAGEKDQIFWIDIENIMEYRDSEARV